MDGWPSIATASYVTATAYWISDGWEIQDYVQKIEEFRESPTAENVDECIQHILNIYGKKRESLTARTMPPITSLQWGDILNQSTYNVWNTP